MDNAILEDQPPDTTITDAGQSLKNTQPAKKLEWHEKEVPVKIEAIPTTDGITVMITSDQLKAFLDVNYPNSIWKSYPSENKVKLIDNLTYLFTAHLPFLLKGNIRLEYNTAYPHVYSWASQCFMRFLPAYWYLNKGRRGMSVFPLLKTLLNSRAIFAQTKDVPPRFPTSNDKIIVIPFTFGKDSFLTYSVAKEIGLHPILVYYNEPTEMFAREHKEKLIRTFARECNEHVYIIDNPLGNLREYGEGWFGWELSLTSWALLSLPFAYKKKAGYILFSNEANVNSFFYDQNGLKVNPDYEQSAQAVEELSLFTQALSEGEVYTTTLLQGLSELGIIGILKDRYKQNTFKYLMSCWAETEAARNKRWCAECSKCARLYAYMSAMGVDPITEAGFKDNMFAKSKEHLYNVFGQKASGTGWDAFGLNTEEQALAFYLCYLRGNRDPLVTAFMQTDLFTQTEKTYQQLIEKYFSLEPENVTPPQWKKRIDKLYEESLKKARKELMVLYHKRKNS